MVKKTTSASGRGTAGRLKQPNPALGTNDSSPEKVLADLENGLDELIRLASTNLPAHATRKLRNGLTKFAEKVDTARESTDTVKLPKASFDPGDPKTVGRMVALALLAQPRLPLASVPDAYGSGVYAIYYNGDHPFYEAISHTETPIYVGKADPETPEASTPREQGSKLTSRLKEHAKTIRAADAHAHENHLPDGLFPIRLKDFECRRLVCATNAQLVAERHLISTFWPLWNSETKVCWGMSKHGDSHKTRKNKRSPWHVIHPGKAWAADTTDEKQEDALSPSEIQRRIGELLERTPPRRSHEQLLEEMLVAFRQDDTVALETETETEELKPPVNFRGPGPEDDGTD